MIRIGERDFETAGKTYIMGILNVTPDSFSDGGSYENVDAALFRAEQMIIEGADVLDIGGESTRPGYTKIGDEEEIERVTPVIKSIKERFRIPISIDTYKSKVAKAAVEAGADLVNDIWGLQYDAELADVIKKYDVAYCLMHNRSEVLQGTIMSHLIEELRLSAKIATQAGISTDKIILDPGIGFAKTTEQNLEILANLGALKELNLPLLLGASKKSVIASMENPPLPIAMRQEGTYVTTVFAVMNGYSFVRVHDVAQNKRVIEMTEALCERQQTGR